MHDVAVDVGETHVAAAKAEGQAGVVEAEQVQHRDVQVVDLHAVLDGVAAAAIGLTFATGLKLLPSGSARLGPLAVTSVTVLCVGVLRWPMLPAILCIAPISIGGALAQPRSGR